MEPGEGDVYTDYGGQIDGTVLEWCSPGSGDSQGCIRIYGLFSSDGHGSPEADGHGVLENGDGDCHSLGANHRGLPTKKWP